VGPLIDGHVHKGIGEYLYLDPGAWRRDFLPPPTTGNTEMYVTVGSLLSVT
jgi:hypothetical protein